MNHLFHAVFCAAAIRPAVFRAAITALFLIVLFLPEKTTPVSAAPVSGQIASSMLEARSGSTATRLADGRVLVAGGMSQNILPASAEIYDPQTNQWQAAAAMITPRYMHRATLLKDGRVLVTGGNKGRSTLPTAELYDPVTDRWIETDAMYFNREGHTATLLADGRVLVIGGYDYDIGFTLYLDSAEVYDPVTGKWKIVGRMISPSYNHSATRLTDGRVLVLGGQYATNGVITSLLQPQIYDPTTEQWRAARAMNTPRAVPTMTLLPNGQVLVAGGGRNIAGQVTFLSDCEVYDPLSDQWRSVGSLALPRFDHQAVALPDGRVIVFGGYRGSPYLLENRVRTPEIFDPFTETWSLAPATEIASSSFNFTATLISDGRVLLTSSDAEHNAELYSLAEKQWRAAIYPLNEGRTAHNAVLLKDGRVMVSGGFKHIAPDNTNTTRLASTEIFDPQYSQWMSGSMSTQRGGHTMTLLADGSVLIVGGLGLDDARLLSAEIHKPASTGSTGSRALTGSTASPHFGHTANLLNDGRVLIIGGREADYGYEIYNPATGLWSQPASSVPNASLISRLHNHASVTLANGRVMVIGGSQDFGSLSRVLLFDPQTNQWNWTGSTNIPRYDAVATLLADGRVLVVGGGNDISNAASAEIYNPANGQWSMTSPMNIIRRGFTATLLADGRVLVAGGEHASVVKATNYLASAEAYDPKTGQWQLTGSMITPRAGHTATRLNDGRVLIAGGQNDTGDIADVEFFQDPCILYVDDSAKGLNNGTSWANAYTDLQAALRAAVPGDQIWVAEGRYYPTSNPADRAASFALRDGVEVYGGFAGTETLLAQRNWAAHPTILSGDIDHGQPTPSGHSYHVVYADTYHGTQDVLDGFTITGGQADGPVGADGSLANRQGGGIYNHANQPILRNLVIEGNTAEQGGGMYADIFARLINVLFRDNTAVYGGGLANGDQLIPDPNHFQAQALLTNVTFSHNTADYGGAIANLGVNGLYLPPDDILPVVTHVTFNENVAKIAGSALYAVGGSRVRINNSIIWGAGSTPLISLDTPSGYIFNRTIIQTGCPAGATCSNVTSADPQLGPFGAALGSPDTYPLGPNSPAIDAAPAANCTRFINTGTLTYKLIPLETDQRGAPRPAGAGCDLGAHEFQAALSLVSGDNQRTDAFTPFPEPLVVGVSSTWGDPVDGMLVRFTPQVSDAGGAVSSSTAVVSGGRASVTTSAKNAPGFSVQASALGFEPATFHLAVHDTKVTLTASPNPVVAGQTVTVTASVAGQLFGLQPSPSGRLLINVNDSTYAEILLPPNPLGGPTIERKVNLDLMPGLHTLKAIFIPDGTTYHDETTSPPVSLLVTNPKPVAAVKIDGLAQTYTGTPRTVTATTTPPGLPVRVTYNNSTTAPTKAGSYTVLAEVTDPNYTGSATGTLEVSKAYLDVKADNLSRPYGTPNPTLTYTISGYINGEGPAAIQGSPALSCDTTPTSPVGSYTIEISQGTLTAENYQFRLSRNKLYVTKAPTIIQLTYSPIDPLYGQPLTFAVTVSGPTGSVVKPSGSLTFSIDGSEVSTTSLDVNGQAVYTTSTLVVGAHTVKAQFAENSSYLGSSGSADLQVKPGTAAITLSGLSFTYDGQPHGATVTTNPAGLAYSITYNGGTGLPVNAGDYGVHATITQPGYSGSANTTLKIHPASITVRAADKSKVYGAANPSLDCTYTGFVNGETAAVVNGSPSLSTGAATASPVGSYTITVGLGTLSAANYSFTPQNGTLTVQKAPLTVRAADQSRLYGAANPQLTYALSGFVNGDTAAVVTGAPDLATSAVVTCPIGQYPITVDSGTLAASNYNFTGSNGTLTVQPAVLTVRANDQSRPYGATNPSLTYAITGFANGETAAVVSGQAAVATTAQVLSPVSTYPITTSQGSLAVANYRFEYAAGTLTITQARTVLELTADDNELVYGQPVTLTARVTLDPPGVPKPAGSVTFTVGGAAHESISLIDGQASLTVTPDTTGSVDYQAQYNPDGNCTGSSAQGTLTVRVANASVTISDLAAVFDGLPHAPIVTTNPAGLHVTLTYNGQPNPPANAGSYSIVAVIDDPKYSGAASGTLVIAKASSQVRLVISPNPALPGQPVTLRAVVTPEGGELPEGVHLGGQVTFSVAGGKPVSVPLSTDGTAVYQVDALPPDSYEVTLQYEGDGNYNGSSAGATQLLIDWWQVFMPCLMQSK